ncbi:MAG TPA: response regulator [Geobacteraceae bacterium]|nr:response regulator [Geobacteraceae bacterium]
MAKNVSRLNKTIMIVDDELFFRKLLRDILEDEGYTSILEVEDGVEAVEKYLQLRPDLTVMDIYMPGKNGIDATKEIFSYDKNARVLICSAAGYDEDVKFATKIGARGIILKPFIVREVTETIQKALEEN